MAGRRGSNLRPLPSQNEEATAGPVEGLGIEDAVPKELGVRLEKQRLPLPFLILDHIDEKPTEN